MAAPLDRIFLEYSALKLQQQAARIVECLSRLDDQQIWLRGSANENSIGNLVLHVSGNVRQWIVARVGNTPDTRDRDAEFAAAGGVSTTDLVARLKATIDEAVAALAQVSAERLAEPLAIQGYNVTGMSAIYSCVEHLSGHTGQIIFATKALTGADLGFHAHLRGNPATHSEKTP
jgi:uncharacterized damage-inducible protein DinB